MDRDRLTRDDWMRVARRALLAGGPEAVRVEPLAEALGVTKGSFYWHFADRAALLDALLAEWENERSTLLDNLRGHELHGPVGIRALCDHIAPLVVASERGDVPSDAAIFLWAARDSRVAKRVNAAESERIRLVQDVVGDRDLGEFLYLAYLGFLMRRRRSPAAAAFFPKLAALSEAVARALTRVRR